MRRKFILKAKNKMRIFLDFHSGGERLKCDLQAAVVSHAFGVKMTSLLTWYNGPSQQFE
jgi:hypothetical protein